eukprot:956282-Amphidinium_carterae.2
MSGIEALPAGVPMNRSLLRWYCSDTASMQQLLSAAFIGFCAISSLDAHVSAYQHLWTDQSQSKF